MPNLVFIRVGSVVSVNLCAIEKKRNSLFEKERITQFLFKHFYTILSLMYAQFQAEKHIGSVVV